MMGNEGISVADALALRNTGYEDGGFAGGAWWIIILVLLFCTGGWGRGGYGYGGGAADNYVLASDFATLQRQMSDGFGIVEKGIDTVRNGLCDGFYTNAQLLNGINTNILQSTNNLGSQLADCCCKTQNGIERINTNMALNTNALTKQIGDAFCGVEKNFMQNRFDMQTYNCATLQAIDKVGDRIIGYLTEDKAQTLRDENQALRLAASQAAQNQYLINQLRPAPIPAFQVSSPYFFGGCNCGGCCC